MSEDFTPDDYQEPEESDYVWHLPQEEVGEEVINFAKGFFEYLRQSNRIDAWTKRINYYNGRYQGQGASFQEGLVRTGSQGQYTRISSNHFRSILQTQMGTITANPISFDYHATNTDYASTQMAAFWRTIGDYYRKHKQFKELGDRVKEYAILVDDGYMMLEWDQNEFSQRQPMANTPGDVKATILLPIDVIFDPYKGGFQDHDFMIVRQRVPRQLLITLYPEYADIIKGLSSAIDYEQQEFLNALFDNNWMSMSDLNDDVTIFKFFHEKTSYMPMGRYCVVLSDGTCVFDHDEGLPYSEIPLERYAPRDRVGSPFGRSPAADLVGLQEAINLIDGSNLSNIEATALQYIAVEGGTEVDISQLKAGLTLFKHPVGSKPPQGLNLTQLSQHVIQYREMLVQQMHQIVGVSEVSRGQVSNNLHSGSALAFAASTTAQGMGPALENAASFDARVQTLLLKILSQFADQERNIIIAGVDNSARSTFSAKNLDGFDRVTAEVGNPITSTPAGQANMAKELLEQRMIDPQQYITVLKTGNLEPALQNPREKMALIQAENEMIMNLDSRVHVSKTDDHHAHMDGLLCILNNRDYRYSSDPRNAQVYMLAIQHYQEHEEAIAQQQQQQQQGLQPLAPQVHNLEEHKKALMAGAVVPGGPPPGGFPGQPQPGAPNGPPHAPQPHMTPAGAHMSGAPNARPIPTSTVAVNNPASAQAAAAGTHMPNMPAMPKPR